MKTKQIAIISLGLISIAAVSAGLYLLKPDQGNPLPSIQIDHKDQRTNCLFNQDVDLNPEYDLAIVLINANKIQPIHLAQLEQDGATVSDHTLYSEIFGGASKRDVHTTMSYTANLHDYGTLKGNIMIGTQAKPDFDKKRICGACKKAVLAVSPQYDAVLFDLKRQEIYDICRESKSFSLRNYTIQTVKKEDNTIDVMITDTNL